MHGLFCPIHLIHLIAPKYLHFENLVSGLQSNVNWTPPSNWTGPNAVFYQSFDSSDGLVLMEGTEPTSDCIPLVSGKVGYIRLFHKK